MPEHPPGAAMALAAAILALPLAVVPVLGGPLALIALALANWSRRRISSAPERYRDSALPTAATVLALVGIGLAAAALLLWILVLAALGSHSPSETGTLY